jgi:hypothetical protein
VTDLRASDPVLGEKWHVDGGGLLLHELQEWHGGCCFVRGGGVSGRETAESS